MLSQSVRNKGNEISNLLKQYEKDRSDALLRKYATIVFIVVASVALACYGYFVACSTGCVFVAFMVVFLFLPYYCIHIPNSIMESFQNGVVKLMLDTWTSDNGGVFKYSEDYYKYADNYSPSADICNLNPFFQPCDPVIIDCFYGNVNGINFSYYGMQGQTGTPTHHLRAKFSGRVFEADMDVPFSDIVIVTTRGGVPAYLDKLDKNREIKAVQLKVDAFSNFAQVFATDAKIVTTLFTEELKDCILSLDENALNLDSKDWGIIFRASRIEIYFFTPFITLNSQGEEKITVKSVYANYDMVNTLIKLATLVKKNLDATVR